MEHALATPETPLPDLTFVETEAVEELRNQQAAMVSHVRKQILASVSLGEVVRNHEEIEHRMQQETTEVSEHAYKSYLDQHLDRDTSPEAYDRLLDLLRQTSATNMDSEKWYLGDTDEDGNHTKPETSGQALVARTLAELRGPAPEEPVPEPAPDAEVTKEEYKEAVIRLKAARARMAKLSIERRQKTINGHAIEEDYEGAREEYEALVKFVGGQRLRRWRKAGLEGDALKAEAVKAVLDEHQAFSEAEIEALKSTRRGKVAEWLARKHRWAWMSGGLGIVTGFGAKWALGLTAGAAVGFTGGAALGAGVAIKAARGLFTAKIGNTIHITKHFNKKRDEDHEALQQSAQNLDVSDHGVLVEDANNLLQSLYDSRVDRDRKDNQKRVAIAAAIGGVAGLAGWGLEYGAERLGFPSLHDLTHQPGHKPSTPPHHPGPGNGHTKPPAPHHPQPPHHPAPAPAKPGVVDGYQSNVQIAHGEGYQQAVSDLVGQKHITLSNAQSWQLYEHLNDKFNGHFFTNDPSYHMDNAGQWGISSPGAAHWNPAVIHEINRWMIANGHQDKLTAATKTTKKVAQTILTGSTATRR